jgi:hypothetical protein
MAVRSSALVGAYLECDMQMLSLFAAAFIAVFSFMGIAWFVLWRRQKGEKNGDAVSS